MLQLIDVSAFITSFGLLSSGSSRSLLPCTRQLLAWTPELLLSQVFSNFEHCDFVLLPTSDAVVNECCNFK